MDRQSDDELIGQQVQCEALSFVAAVLGSGFQGDEGGVAEGLVPLQVGEHGLDGFHGFSFEFSRVVRETSSSPLVRCAYG